MTIYQITVTDNRRYFVLHFCICLDIWI